MRTTMTGGGELRRWCQQVLAALAGVLLLPVIPAGAANWNPLPDTGQEQFFGMDGKKIPPPAEGQPLQGQDAGYRGAVPAYGDNGETVMDKNTGLVWMKGDDGTPRVWQDAVAYCDGLDFAGWSDWRLPAKFELDSIVDYGRSYPALNPVFRAQASFYWSSVVYRDDPTYAWGAYANDGGDHWLDKRNRYYVRCVRAGL